MTPKLFVTDYKSYNEGEQFKHGKWVDLDQFNSSDEFFEWLENHFNQAVINDPEIMFTDFEDFPKKFYSESFDKQLIEDLFEFLEARNECQNAEALDAFVELGNDYSDFDDHYYGEYDSDEDFAQSLAEDCGYLDKEVSWPYNHIDWTSAARDLMQDYTEQDGYYFRIR